MVTYPCIRCGKVFLRKSHHDYHFLKRKNPCQLIHAHISENIENGTKMAPKWHQMEPNWATPQRFTCPQCPRSYMQQKSLTRHIKLEHPQTAALQVSSSNSHGMPPPPAASTVIVHTNHGTINNIQHQQCSYQKNVTNTTTNITNIVIPFGKEDLSKINPQEYVAAFMQATGFKLAEKLVETIHFNKNHPQFKNVYISDPSRKKAMIHNGQKWIAANSEEVATHVLNKSITYGIEGYDDIDTHTHIQSMTDKHKLRIKKGIEMLELMQEIDCDEDEYGNPLPEHVKMRKKYLRENAEKAVKMFLYNISK